MSSVSGDIGVPGRPEVHEVSAGIYAYVQPDGTWWINNTGFLVGPQGVVSIDSCSTERRTRAYQDAIAEVTGAPVRTVINTHHHGDHTFGNCLFPGAAIVAHERTRAEAIAFGPPRDLGFWDGPDWGDLALDPPFVTFTDEIAVHSGDLRAQVRARRHRRAYDKRLDHLDPRALRPVLRRLDLQRRDAVCAHGLGVGAIEVLEHVVRPLGAQTIVPGHGPVFERSGPVDATLDYLGFVQDVAARGRDAGLPPLQAAREADLGRFAELGRHRADRRQPAPRLRRAGRRRRPALPSTSSPPWPTWSPTTAASRSPAWPEPCLA